jgi:uridine kinase
MASFDDLVRAAEGLRSRMPRAVVGISGFGGAGKSTLARRLVEAVPGAVRLRGDDFIVPSRAAERSSDWAMVDRLRLRDEVLVPYRAGSPGRFRRYDWSTSKLLPSEPLSDAGILVLDAVGILHPDLDEVLDLRVWIDVDLDVATARGKARDRRAGNDHDRLWDDVWVPNDRDFGAAFRPWERADLRYVESA